MPDFPQHFPSVQKKLVSLYKEGERFRLRYRVAGKRKSTTFATLNEAQSEAKRLAARLKKHELLEAPLSKGQEKSYRAAMAALQGDATPLEDVCREWKRAVAALPEGISLEEAVRNYGRSHGSVVEVAVEEAVEQYLTEREREVSARYLEQERLRLKRFASAFRCSVSEVTRVPLSAWLASIKGSAKTYNHYVSSVSAFLKWAGRKDYLPTDHRLKDVLGKRRVDVKDVAIYTPDEFDTLLEVCDPRIRIRLAIIGLAGIRVAESARLTVENIKEGYVEVTGAQSKTRARRVVPICERLQAILDEDAEFLEDANGFSSQHFNLLVQKAHRAGGVAKKENGLRHSYCSYRLALTQDEGKVALESGNSPQMIHKHYKALVRQEDAKKWFGGGDG